VTVRPDLPEALRYLGVSAPDDATLRLVEKAEGLLRRHTEPRFVHRLCDVLVRAGRVELLGRAFESESLSAHLFGCTHAVLFAMTLGAGVDRLIARYAQTDIALAAALQAVAAAAVEAACDDYCRRLAEQAQRGELTGHAGYLTARFSPGYGDLPLHCQKDVLELLNAPVRIGLTATGSFMLAPGKSVTAFVGISPVPVQNCCCACQLCGKKDCAFRKTDSNGANL